ncbi:MAG: dihydroorotase [Acidobacteriaceae bacterium]|nr:dihydroorotase [Acidobacteriaceae bacterium]MBV9763875.1 dihydroorotase [Acidobacteriaceae bacterium]
MSKLVIKNGRVIDPSQQLDRVCDLAIENGIVREIGPDLQVLGSDEFDASGLIVAPGFIDMHVHLREPGFEHAETIETGSRTAAAGGFTSICCMPNTQPVNDNATVTNYIRDQARRFASVNVFPIGAITKGSGGEELSAIASMKKAGIVAISDDGRPVMNARVARRAMEFAQALDLSLIEHCEDLHLSAGGDMHEGIESTRLGLRGIPRSSEDVMVARDILLAEVTGCRYHVAHISSKNSVEMVGFAKRRGLKVTAEATPHHFALTDSEMRPYDSNYKMKPPIRERCDANAVSEGLVSGAIDAIATDHAPHPGAEKMQEFERCPFGIIGLETAVGLALEHLYHPGKLDLSRFVQLFTNNPARIVSIDRGTLRAGAPADITIFGLDHEWTYDVNRSPSKSRNTPFHGHKFRGGPIATIVGGQVVWKMDA